MYFVQLYDTFAKANILFFVKRINFIDIAKGIGIVLVYLGHSSFSETINKFIFIFHMPFFFFVSGFMFKPNNASFVDFIQHKIKTLLLPYLFFSIVNLLFLFVVSTKYSWSSIFFNGWQGIALWFVISLFITLLLAGLFLKGNNKLDWISIAIALIIYIIIDSLKSFSFPYKIELIPLTYFWFAIGYKSSKKNFVMKCIEAKYWFLIFFLLTYLFSWLNPYKIDLAINQYKLLYYALLGSFFGILMLFNFSFYIDKHIKIKQLTNLFSYLGKNTFVILAFHQVYNIAISFLMVKFHIISLYAMFIKHLTIFILLYFSIEIMNRYLYFFLGKQKS